MMPALVFLSAAIAAGPLRVDDDLREKLGAIADGLTGEFEEDLSAVWPVFAEVIGTRPRDVEEELRRIAEKADSVAVAVYQSERSQGGAAYVCLQALHCLWMTTRPEGYFRACVDAALEKPVLAGAAMHVLARSPNPAESERYATIVEDVRKRFPRTERGGVAHWATRGWSEHGRTCNVAIELKELSRADRLKRFIELSITATDWSTPEVCEQLLDRGVQTEAFVVGRDVASAAVYWARSNLYEISVAEPDAVADALAQQSFKQEVPLRRSATGSTDISDLFIDSMTKILLRDCLSPECAAKWMALREGRKEAEND